MPFWVFWCHFWRCKMFWVNSDFECIYINKHGCLFHCNTSTFRKSKYPITVCSILLSDNYLNIKTCNWNEWYHSSIQQKNHPKSSQEVSCCHHVFVSANYHLANANWEKPILHWHFLAKAKKSQLQGLVKGVVNLDTPL